MTDMTYALLQLGVMALVTYLVRMLPMTLFTKKIKSRFLRSFLYYVPYAVLGAMTFPAIFTSTGSVISAVVGCFVAAFLAYKEKSLTTVAIAACLAVFLSELIIL